MKRILASLIIVSLALFGVLHAVGMAASSADAMSGAMGSAFSCMNGACSNLPGGTSAAGACANYCLSGSAATQSTTPMFLFGLIFAFALAAFFFRKISSDDASDIFRRFSDSIARQLQHAKLETIVLRN